MSKNNEYLTEIVYQIDDLIYEFYRKSNDLIATRRNQEELFNFRDQTISTVNNMNVRALEMIASLKKDEIVVKRSEILYLRNKDILDSAYRVLETSPIKNDLFNEVKSAAKDALKFTHKAINDFQDTETYATIKETTEKGYVKLKDAVHKVSTDERVVEGVNLAKEKSKELLKGAEEVYHKGETSVKNWWDTNHKNSNVKEDLKDVKEDLKEDFEDVKEDADALIHEKRKEFLALKEKYENNTETVIEDAKDVLEDLPQHAKDEYHDLKETLKNKTAEELDALRAEYKDISLDDAQLSKEVEDLKRASRKLRKEVEKTIKSSEDGKEEGSE
ncbi:MAG: hypothetical protein GX038_01155 [Erysipelothrix sp.]|nr:hypothetical protein [Erysipelothrix sp.]